MRKLRAVDQYEDIRLGRNRRIGKEVNGTVVQRFVYKDQLNPVAELDGNGALVAEFVYGAKPNVPDYMIHYDDAAPGQTTTYRIMSASTGYFFVSALSRG